MKSDAELRSIPVVVLSVVTNEGRGKLLGAVDFIAKPFEREDILRVLWRNLGRRSSGRVLLMVNDAAKRMELSEVVTANGLEVTVAQQGEVLDILGDQAPDAVVLDLGLSDFDTIAALRELRDNRVYTGLPVLVVTREGISHEEQEVLDGLATIHADGTSAGEALKTLLDASFPLSSILGAAE